ncbi:hypothetical protein FRB95_014134 [Tulasnella sp. JGI-2019a]|nr:hypothetical protein FRB95_014134 [Tulasnella sp. JGI-2019a]
MNKIPHCTPPGHPNPVAGEPGAPEGDALTSERSSNSGNSSGNNGYDNVQHHPNRYPGNDNHDGYNNGHHHSGGYHRHPCVGYLGDCPPRFGNMGDSGSGDNEGNDHELGALTNGRNDESAKSAESGSGPASGGRPRVRRAT